MQEKGAFESFHIWSMHFITFGLTHPVYLSQ